MADVTLITGATRGLGYALSVEAAAMGHHVLALGRTQGALDDLADAIDALPGAVTMIPMDITDDDAIAYMAQSVFERFGRIDYWLHSAWFMAPQQPVAHLLKKDIDDAYRTNVRASARLIHVLDPILRNSKGAKAVFFEDPTLYAANMGNNAHSKSAQMVIARNYKAECAKIGPQVEIVAPSPMRTQARATLFPGENRDALAEPATEAKRIWQQFIGCNSQDGLSSG